MNGLIDEDTLNYLHNRNPRTSTFYMLPKIHKPGNPGRPIVNSIDSITERISAYVDETLKELSKLVPSYIKDTSHFLQVLQSIDVQPEDYLVTIDVSSLYTNIPHKEGIDHIMDWMLQKGISTEESRFIADLAKLVLQCNYFEFDNKIYHQVSGTAMGTRMAPNYAIIFMHYIEETILNTSPLKPRIWKRFIDDIFMVWQHGKDTLDDFLEVYQPPTPHHQIHSRIQSP